MEHKNDKNRADKYWNDFLKTGSVSAYLAYRKNAPEGDRPVR